MSNKKAFTLIEIIVVLVIIGILVAIALPNYFTFVQQGETKAAQNNLVSIYNAQKTYYYSNNSYCIAGCDSITDMNKPANLNLNISDNYFSYSCSTPADGTFACYATNIADANFILTVTNNPIALPGCTDSTPPCTSFNPKCSDVDNPSYCPS